MCLSVCKPRKVTSLLTTETVKVYSSCPLSLLISSHAEKYEFELSCYVKGIDHHTLPYGMSVHDMLAVLNVKRHIYSICAVLNSHLKPETQSHIIKLHDSLLALVHDTDSYMLVVRPLDGIRHRLHFICLSSV